MSLYIFLTGSLPHGSPVSMTCSLSPPVSSGFSPKSVWWCWFIPVIHSSQEAKAEGLWIWGQPRLHDKTLSQIKDNKIKYETAICHSLSQLCSRSQCWSLECCCMPKQLLVKSDRCWHTRGITDFSLAVSSWNYPAIPKWISTNLTVLPRLTWRTVYSVVSGDYLIAVKSVRLTVALKTELCRIWLNFPTLRAQMGGWNAILSPLNLSTWKHSLINFYWLAALIHSLSRFINIKTKVELLRSR